MEKQLKHIGKEEKKKTEPLLQWEGQEPLPIIPDDNFASFMLEKMSVYGDAVVLVDAASRKELSYNELCHLVPRVSGGLAQAGVQEGDAVLLLISNHIYYPLLFLSIIHRGAVCVPCNPTVTPEDLANVLRVSGARWAVVHEYAVSLAEAAFSHLPPTTLRNMWVQGPSTSNRPNCAHLLDHQEPLPPLSTGRGFDAARTVSMLLMTSGTTGQKKGVMISHRNLLSMMVKTMYINDTYPPGTTKPREMYRTQLLLMPFFHIYGIINFLITLIFGTTGVVVSKFFPENFLKTIQEFKVTAVALVPHVIHYLADTPLTLKYDISSLQVILSAGQPLPSSSASSFRLKTGISVSDCYAMTESCGFVTESSVLTGYKEGSVGKVLPYFQLKVVDTESGEPLGAEMEGEVCFRGPSTFLGYCNNPSATDVTIDSHGWVHSGDFGYFDQEGFLFITDRLKDLIKVKGFQVCPSEIEVVIKQHPSVSDAAVVGVPHNRLGEAPRAYIVLSQDATVDSQELQDFVAARVASYKSLAGGVQVVDSIPRTSIGKVLRKELRKLHVSQKAKL